MRYKVAMGLLFLFYFLSVGLVYAESNRAVGEDNTVFKCSKLDKLPVRYKPYQVPPWELLKISKFKRAYFEALSPIKKYKLIPYLQKLDVVLTSSMIRLCMTSNGLAMIYEGEKPRWATDSLRIVYFPDTETIALRVKVEFVVISLEILVC